MLMSITMYSNQALPLAIRVSSQSTRFLRHFPSNSQSLPIGYNLNPSKNPACINFTKNRQRPNKHSNILRPWYYFDGFWDKPLDMASSRLLAKPKDISSGFRMRSALHCCASVRVRSFSSLSSLRVSDGNRLARTGKALPWLKAKKARAAKEVVKVTRNESSRSSWEESIERLEKESNDNSQPSWEESAERLDRLPITKNGHSSWEEDTGTSVENRTNGNRTVGMPKNRQNVYIRRSARNVAKEKDDEDLEVDDDRRRGSIRSNRFRENVRADKPEFRRWNNEENFGRKPWKEANESTIPKMVGEGLYGVGPILAALSSGRREFYALYVQEGFSLSSNSKKKKDKKAFEKVMKMAEESRITIKEVSKHDLNMIVNSRPHQGLVLDASPLEMVKIKELDPVSSEEDKNSLWVALDEVTDPQNLGAIIRSAYFFGATGVVLCAKNSAPLSGVVSKASAGSLELMELRYCNNMMQFLVSSGENGWRVIGGSVSSKSIPLNEVEPSLPTVLVLGSEGKGLRPLVERSCTHLVRIPGNIPVDVTGGGIDDVASDGYSDEQFRSFMAVESLNVSVAAGVLLHHLVGHQYDSKSSGDDYSTDQIE